MKQKVLVVDDEPLNRKIVEETLGDQVELAEAINGEEALKAVETSPPDLVLLDLMMPGMDGYEVCSRIKANPGLKLTKVILVSGKAMLEERLKGYEVGADDYMTKPFAQEELFAKSRVFLRLTLAERQLADLNLSLEEKVRERTTQLLEAEARLVNSAKMAALGEMAGGIAHEINTPLSTISMLGEQIGDLIKEETVDRKEISRMTQVVGQTVVRIAAIIRGLKAFSRDGSQDVLRPASLKRIVDETIALCGEKLKHTSVQLRLEPIPEDLEIQCRSVQISQVMLNLISNACDAIFALQDKWIEISVKTQGDQVEISVTDSGHGIPERIRDKIFQPFFTTKEIGKGTGLGLSVSKGIIDGHHGSMSIDLECRNTRFVLRFPLQARKVA